MNKVIKFFTFGIVCFLFCFLINVHAETKCDINGDGILNDSDGELLRKMLVDDSLMPAKGSAEFERIDCNDDGKITLQDLVSASKKVDKEEKEQLKNNGQLKNKVSCGNIDGIPKKIPELTSYCMKLVQVLVPVLLVILGMLDLFKGLTAQKEDEIKKGQSIFIKRLIVAVLIFFITVLVKVIISIIAENSSTNIIDCMDCFISEKCN